MNWSDKSQYRSMGTRVSPRQIVRNWWDKLRETIMEYVGEAEANCTINPRDK